MPKPKIKLDLVAPPFAGHLFPLLDLGWFLQDSGVARVRVLSTRKAQQAIHLSGLEGLTLLSDKEAQIAAIADPPYQVKNNPRFLVRQLGGNLALMGEFRKELLDVWRQDKPDLVLADFTLPVAGLLAQELGIRWWTSLPTPCALESHTGTPTYLGGWKPGDTLFHTLRDTLGRNLIRNFKRLVAWRYRKVLLKLNLSRLYRANGEEAIYSPTKILALGIQEFEFEQDWPAALQFVGPITASPPFEHIPPQFELGKKHILVSLGTHIPWAKEKAADFTKALSEHLPEFNFHFSYGQSSQLHYKQIKNVCFYSYIPYHYLQHYDVAIIHGGAGITYSCMKAGVPMLVWPHDYDQFDHGARVVMHGLGFRINGQLRHTVELLQRLLVDPTIQKQIRSFKERLETYNAHRSVLQELEQTFKLSSKQAFDPK